MIAVLTSREVCQFSRGSSYSSIPWLTFFATVLAWILRFLGNREWRLLHAVRPPGELPLPCLRLVVALHGGVPAVLSIPPIMILTAEVIAVVPRLAHRCFCCGGYGWCRTSLYRRPPGSGCEMTRPRLLPPHRECQYHYLPRRGHVVQTLSMLDAFDREPEYLSLARRFDGFAGLLVQQLRLWNGRQEASASDDAR